MKAEKCKQLTVQLSPEDIKMLKECDAISLRMESTTGDTKSQMWVYTDRFLTKLGYD